ncbi:MAG TPA: PAS domain-containing protein [Ohtaekwangia sp.]|nr:PAS domain-containing protein [Ohtaekwangia sp.]
MDAIEPTPSLELPLMRAYARFLTDHLDELTILSIDLYRKYKVPLLEHLETYSEKDLHKMSKEITLELLGSFTRGTIGEHIQRSIERWIKNQITFLERNEIQVDDVALSSYVRKKILQHFLPRYTSEPDLILRLMEELDNYTYTYSSYAYKAFITLLEDRLATNLKRLEESQRLFEQAQSITHIGNYYYKFSTKQLTWTDELYRIYGLELGVIISNKLIKSFTHPEDALDMQGAIDKAVETRAAFDFHYRIVVKEDIKVLHALGEIIMNENGEAIGLFGTIQDVTHEKLTEDILIQNQHFIRKITDAAPSIITLYNVHTLKYQFLNAGVKKLLGYDPELPLKEGVQFFMGIVHPEDLPTLVEENATIITAANQYVPEDKDEVIVNYRYRMRHNDGAYRWFKTYGTVFKRNREGKVLSFLNITLDISEQVIAEEIIEQRSVELKQSNERLKQYAFIASHDLKEPLRKISLFSSRLREVCKPPNDAEGIEFIDKIINSSLHLQKMVNDLLSLAELSRPRSLDRQNLQKIFDEVVHSLEHRIHEVNALVVTDQLPDAMVIPSEFLQLFQNLLNNALKFTRPGVQPIINVTHYYKPNTAVRGYKLKSASRYLCIKFSDNGIGFDNAFAERIFNIFQRLHSRTAFDGTGMGLSICKQIVENHGGVILANGREDYGADFTIIIPA